MKLKVLLVTVFAAGLGASFALANDGHGEKNGEGHKKKCTEVHLRGTIAPQALTVALEKASKKLNLAAGSSAVLQLGATGQTVRVNAEACLVTVGSATQLQVKSLELRARTPKATTTTTAAATTAPATTTAP
jgi:hypothetical protein